MCIFINIRSILSKFDEFRDKFLKSETTHAQNFVWNVANWVCKYPCPVLTHCYWPRVPFNGIRNLKPDSLRVHAFREFCAFVSSTFLLQSSQKSFDLKYSLKKIHSDYSKKRSKCNSSDTREENESRLRQKSFGHLWKWRTCRGSEARDRATVSPRGGRKEIYKAAERFKEVVLHGALTYNLVRPTHLEHYLEN